MNKLKKIRLVLTKDELYLIEREADQNSSTASRNIYKMAHTFLIFGGIEYGKESTDPIRKMLMQSIQEHHEASEVWNSIRKKCERLRKKE